VSALGRLLPVRRPDLSVDMRLEATGVKVHFEGVRAVDGVDITLERTQILGLIGPNGAGKTTLVNALSGFQRPTAGQVQLGGAEVTGWPPHRLARRGLSRTFQNIRLFPFLSVYENVEAGAVSTGMPRREATRWTNELLERFLLGDKSASDARALPYGDERRLGIARALATRPRFLLLDEPAAGLNEVESEELARSLREIHGTFGCGLLVIEHDMQVIMSLCDRIQVLDYGKTIAIGTPAEIRRDPAVLAAYLGTEGTEESINAPA
jgi:ABC-type branched-subunit amino acid transport system ATPase component